MKFSKALVEELECQGVGVYHKYSGRFMYGATCFGVVGDVDEFVGKMYLLSRNPEFGAVCDEFFTGLAQKSLVMRFDSLCTDTIYYFPDITVEEDEKDEE